jgi:hypothetical protein
MKTTAAIFVMALVAGSAFASDISQVNAYRIEGRNWGDFHGTSVMDYGPAAGPLAPAPGVAFTATQGPIAGGMRIREVLPAGVGGGTNHGAWLSDDGGASRFGLWGGGEGSGGQSFNITTTIRMQGGQTAPRKEGGLKIRNPRPALNYTDDGLVMVASDGEVAVFGAVMPFTGLGGSVYTFGTTATIDFTYYAPGVVDPVLGAYRLIFTDAVTGVHNSGLKLWSATEPDGAKGFNNGTEIGLHFQGFNNLVLPDAVDITYGNITITPAPGALALLGLGGLVATRRRR